MKEKEQDAKWELHPEKSGYPWQTLEADRESWIVVRWQERIASQPIAEIAGVSLKDFSWKIGVASEEKHLYQGEISLQVIYQVMGTEQKKALSKDAPKEAWQEEHLFNKGLFTEKKEEIKTGFAGKNLEKGTEFPALLLDGAELKREPESSENLSEEIKTCAVSLPWQCWLKGKGANQPPSIIKIHVGQVGLYTLLVEVLIKLEKVQNVDECNEEKLNNVLEEDMIFVVKGDSISEILGMPEERAFWRYSYDARLKSVLLKTWKRINLVYLSSLSGGERFMFASGAGAEETVQLKGYPNSFYPIEIQPFRELLKYSLIGQNKICYQAKSFYRVSAELLQEEKEERLLPPIEPMSEPIVLPFRRSKPGEKWLKREEHPTKTTNRSIMTIKLEELSQK